MRVARFRRTVVGSVLLAVVATGCPPPGGGGGGGSYTFLFSVTDTANFVTSASQRSMSADGRYVVYRIYDESTATSNAMIFDRVEGTRTVIKAFSAPFYGPYSELVISEDGSTVYFNGPTGPAPPPRLVNSGLYRYDVATGQLDSFDLPVDPGTGYSISAEELTTDADGSKVAFVSAPDDFVWTEAGGFQALPAGTGQRRWIRPPGMSPNGRFVSRTEVISLPDPDGDPATGEPEMIKVDVLDVETGEVHASWSSGVRVVYRMWFGPDPWDTRMGTTLDDGSVLFTYNSNAGVFLLDGTTGLRKQVAGYESVTLQGGSWNGRFVSYVGPSHPIVPELSSVNELVDRVTAGVTRVSGYTEPGSTVAKAVSNDGRFVLLRTREPGRAPNGEGVYLWDRGA